MLESFSKNTVGIYDPQERQSSLFWMLHTRVSMFLVTALRSEAAAGVRSMTAWGITNNKYLKRNTQKIR